MRQTAFFVFLSFLAVAAFAQTTVGVMPSNLNTGDASFPTPQTDVSLENPVNAGGSIDQVTFAWSATCNAVVKIKFFRRSGNSLTLVDSRGPFDTLPGTRQTIGLVPAVSVAAGDLIGITRVQSCGHAMAEAGTGTQGYVVLQGDASSGTIASDATVHDKLALAGTGPAPQATLSAFIPVVGSTAGSFGSNFKTSVQIFNPSSSASAAGKLIFHKANSSGSAGDPSLSFSLGPGEMLAMNDAVAAMVQSGLGSMDVSMSSGQLPIVVSRIYNDQGANGTSGVFEDLVPPTTGTGTRVLTPGVQGFLITPLEPSRTRFNIGIRALSSGATLTMSLEDTTGHVLGAVTKTYLPDYFEQNSFDFYFGIAAGANQRVRVTVSNGNAIVYGATTDNVTNDPSVQFATALPTSL